MPEKSNSTSPEVVKSVFTDYFRDKISKSSALKYIGISISDGRRGSELLIYSGTKIRKYNHLCSVRFLDDHIRINMGVSGDIAVDKDLNTLKLNYNDPAFTDDLYCAIIEVIMHGVTYKLTHQLSERKSNTVTFVFGVLLIISIILLILK